MAQPAGDRSGRLRDRGHSGEIDFETLDKVLQENDPLLPQKGCSTKRRSTSIARPSAADTPLRFPGKILADEAHDRLFIADSNHNRIVIARLDGTLIDTIGSGEAGSADGDYAKASFNHPQGMALAGDVLYVADTENHLLRRVDLKKPSDDDRRHRQTGAGDAWSPATRPPSRARRP